MAHSTPSAKSRNPNKFTTSTRKLFFDHWQPVSTQFTLRYFIEHNEEEEWCPSYATASRWLRQKEQIEKGIERSPSRPRGRPRKNVDYWIDIMAKGPHDLSKQDYSSLMEQSGVSYKTLRRRVAEKQPNVLYSKLNWTSQISANNKQLRLDYGQQHRYETIETLWQWIHWTDECHLVRAAALQQFMFREPGNWQGAIANLVLHAAASVSWHHKSPLVFYNDEDWTHAHITLLWKLQTPRKKKDEEQYNKEVEEWNARKPPHTEKRGYPITNARYTESILPQHLNWMNHLKEQGHLAILMEDGDTSHGHRSHDNPAESLRQKALVQLHNQPPQSPDLHPMKGLWLLLQERLKARYQEELYSMGVEDFKAAITEVWNQTTLDEVRDRIQTMPYRCYQLTQKGGQRVRTDK